MYKFRDPTELRRLYKVKMEAMEAWHSAIEKMFAGDDTMREKMPALTEQVQEAHRQFSAESQYFVRSGPAM